jgi:tetratricopeptide (TPR) repeat protein
VVGTEAEATNLLHQIQSGQSFEAIAKAHSIDPSAKDGGYLGLFRLTDLKADLQRAVAGLMPGQISPVTPAGGEFLILQRLTLEEQSWIASYDAGLEAFQNARYDEAARRFSQSLPYAEKLRPVDSRLENTLHGLAEAYRLEKKYAEAEPLYRRYLVLHWGGAGASEVPEVLDRLSAMVALAYYHDSQFEEARKKFQEAVNRAPLGEALYEAMGTILFKAQLITEAEALVDRATQLFPASKDARYYLAEMYRVSSKVKKALEVFDQISRMKTPESVDPAVDRLQQSFVFLKIGSIHADLVEWDDAAAAYKKALEFTPLSVEAHLGLGFVYSQQGRPEDALNEYNSAAAADPKSVAAHFGMADAYLRLGRSSEASVAAANVLDLDAGHVKAHYVLATALARMGAKEESDKEFEIFRKAEAEARSRLDRSRDIIVANRDAAAKLLEGRTAEAVAAFQNVVATFPDSVTAYLNLGIAQSKLGQHKAAIDTFQKIQTLNLSDGFLVSWNLAQEYQYLGDVEASRRHKVVYLQNIDLALREALESNLE